MAEAGGEQTAAATATGFSRRGRIVIGVLLLLHVVVAGDAAWRLSVTHDEYWHLPVGVMHWQTGRFDQERLNPPAARLWAAAPVALMGGQMPDAARFANPAGYGDAFLQENRERFTSLFFAGRMMILLLSAATGLVLAVWSREWFGEGPACLTALLWFVSPLVLGHGSLVTTDLPSAFCWGVTLWCTARWRRDPTWRRTAVVGGLLGLSLLVKFTNVLLIPLLPMMLVLFPGERSVPLLKWIGRLAAAYGAALLVLNAGFLFQGTLRPLAEFEFQSTALQGLQSRLGAAARCPVPVPADWLLGIDAQRHVMEGTQPVYLDGRWSTEGSRAYYLWCLWYKLPHAVQALVLLGLLRLTVNGAWRQLLGVLVPFSCLLAIAGLSRMQLGLRYLLPVWPCLILVAGVAAQWIDKEKSRLRSGLVWLLIVAAAASLRVHPEHLAYFNEATGGIEGGPEHLLDSNIDWGQDLGQLAAYLEEDPLPDGETLKLAYFGTLPPAEFGIDYELPPQELPEPGWYAASVNFIYGRPGGVVDASGHLELLGLDVYGYLRFFEPEARIGASIRVYRVTEVDVVRWRSAMQSPDFSR